MKWKVRFGNKSMPIRLNVMKPVMFQGSVLSNKQENECNGEENAKMDVVIRECSKNKFRHIIRRNNSEIASCYRN